MSRHMHCDRCGVYESSVRIENSLRWHSLMLVGEARVFDLCEKCWQSFGQWLSEQVKET